MIEKQHVYKIIQKCIYSNSIITGYKVVQLTFIGKWRAWFWLSLIGLCLKLYHNRTFVILQFYPNIGIILYKLIIQSSMTSSESTEAIASLWTAFGRLYFSNIKYSFWIIWQASFWGVKWGPLKIILQAGKQLTDVMFDNTHSTLLDFTVTQSQFKLLNLTRQSLNSILHTYSSVSSRLRPGLNSKSYLLCYCCASVKSGLAFLLYFL